MNSLHYTLLTVPPLIDSSTSAKPQVVDHESVTIFCNASGISEPAVQWVINGQPLDALNPRYHIHADGRKLDILRAEVSDTGSYTCTAKNEAGLASRTFELEVLGGCLLNFLYYLKRF